VGLRSGAVTTTSHRSLDVDEQRILDAVRQGAADVLASGFASLEIRWDKVAGEEGEWPEFALSPSASRAPTIACWLWPRERELGNVVLAGFSVGDSGDGIVATLGAPDRDGLALNVTEIVRAFVEGRASYVTRPASAEEYEPAPAEGSLTVVLKCHSAKRDWASSTRGYLEDPAAFRRTTGLAIDEGLGAVHAFAAYVAP
jgi:hypothetical protein